MTFSDGCGAENLEALMPFLLNAGIILGALLLIWLLMRFVEIRKGNESA